MAIISHSRKFIFVKTMKTAGTSLEMALSKHCSPGDILTQLEPREERQRREVAGIGAQNYLTPLSEYPVLRRLKKLASGRREFKFGTSLADTHFLRTLSAEVNGKSEAVCPSLPIPNSTRSNDGGGPSAATPNTRAISFW